MTLKERVSEKTSLKLSKDELFDLVDTIFHIYHDTCSLLADSNPMHALLEIMNESDWEDDDELEAMFDDIITRKRIVSNNIFTRLKDSLSKIGIELNIDFEKYDTGELFITSFYNDLSKMMFSIVGVENIPELYFSLNNLYKDVSKLYNTKNNEELVIKIRKVLNTEEGYNKFINDVEYLEYTTDMYINDPEFDIYGNKTFYSKADNMDIISDIMTILYGDKFSDMYQFIDSIVDLPHEYGNALKEVKEYAIKIKEGEI